MTKHFNLKVSGRVQGVFFRVSTKEQADALNIKGFVRNEPDGGVYIEAEGGEEELLLFSDWCHKGPAHAHVESCTLSEGVVRNYKDFSIQR